MTQKEFNNYFKMEVLPLIAKQYETDGIPDRPARRGEYNNTLDYFHRGNQITDNQANTWSISDSLETTKYWL
tara:strand:- start:2603 stop:2818 length:216 start_codon:yes stop_codon:yes gene_type:complete